MIVTAVARLGLAAVTALAPAFAALPAASQSTGEMIGKWQYACPAGRCRGMLGVREGGQNLLGLVIQPAEGGTLTLLARVPLDAVLPPGVRVYTAEDDHVDLAYQTCTREGCDAVAVLDGEVLTKIGATGTLRVVFLRQDGTGGTIGHSYLVPTDGLTELLVRLGIDSD